MWIKLSKIFYLLLLIYSGWFQIVFFEIPHMLLALGSGMMVFIFLHALQTRASFIKLLTWELKLWTWFAGTSLVFGLLVAVNYEYLISSVTTFCEFLVLMFGIIYISNQDRGIDFFIKVFIGFAVLCAITTVFWGVSSDADRISMGLNDNPNALGIKMALGVCCILYELNFKKLVNSIFSFSVILLLIYVCLLTGSRKSFLSIVIIIIYWFVFVAFKEIKALRFTAKVKGILSILLVIGAIYYILTPLFEDSILLKRLTVLFESGSQLREDMYDLAFDLFKQSPFIGIGLNNYRAVSKFQTYSHSTYAEAMACTGILGCILYFTPYIILLFNYKKLLKSKLDALLIKQSRMMLMLFSVLLFLGVGIIHFYEITSNIAFGMIIAFYNVNKTLIYSKNMKRQ